MRVLVLAILLLAAAMSGCADRAEAISAKDGLGPAREAARAHGEDPVLMGIVSIEPMRHMAGEDFEVWIHLDKNPGDGRAPGWLYTFQSGDRFIGVAYAAGLGVIAEGYEEAEEDDEMEFDMNTPIANWTIDSTEAARIVRGLPEWPAHTDDVSVFWSLSQMAGRPVWFVEWGNDTSSAEVAIDAQNGSVSEVERMEWVMEEIECAWTDSPGAQVSPLASTDLSIELPSGGDLSYEYAWSMTLGDAVMRIDGPDGQVEQETLSGNGMAMGSLGWLPPGLYTMSFEAPMGIGEVSDLQMTSCG